MTDVQRPKQFIRRVLVVDDDYELTGLLREVLTYENCAVDVAANGMEAMDMLRSGEYEAVLCDLMMPRVDGEALYNDVVRQFPYLADRFLFMTGQPFRRAGFTDFVFRSGSTVIEKPFEIEQLRHDLLEVFSR